MKRRNARFALPRDEFIKAFGKQDGIFIKAFTKRRNYWRCKVVSLFLITTLLTFTLQISSNPPSNAENGQKQHHPLDEVAETMEILVLGVHHSGTSLVTKLLSSIGVYAGEETDLLMLPDNPLKYFELKDAVHANRFVLKHGWSKIGPWWFGYGFEWGKVPDLARKKFQIMVSDIIQKMRSQANGRSWVIKDPRLCLVAEQYLKLMSNAVCVFVWRDALELAHRLLGYNRIHARLSLVELLELWTNSMSSAIASCENQKARLVFISYKELMQSPGNITKRLQHLFRNSQLTPTVDLTKLNQTLQETVVRSYKLKRSMQDMEKDVLSRLEYMIDERPKLLSHYLESSGILKIEGTQWMKPSWASHRLNFLNEAYVNIVTSNDIGYLSGATVLGASIRTFDSKRDMVAMVVRGFTSEATRQFLERSGWITKIVEKVPEVWYTLHPKCRGFNQGQKVRWGRMYSKLNIWKMPYERIVYLDTDTLVLRSIEHYFHLPLPFYGERSPSHPGINAGILVIRPSQMEFSSIEKFARTNEPLQFFKRNQVGCTEQELLNQYWNGSNMQIKLNDTRHADYVSKRFTEPEGRSILVEKGATVVHWLTRKCPKPWDVPISMFKHQHNKHGIKFPKFCDPHVYKIWHYYYWSIQSVQKISQNGEMDIPAGLRSISN